MKPWDKRPFEERNLFNPAFCGLVIFRAMQAYEAKHSGGMPFSLLLLVLPLCLHKESREIFAEKPKSYLLNTIETESQLLLGFSGRTRYLMPYTLEALGFLMQLDCFLVSPNGSLKSKSRKVRKSISGTPESISCQTVAKYIGREFARVADPITIYTTFGIRP